MITLSSRCNVWHTVCTCSIYSDDIGWELLNNNYIDEVMGGGILYGNHIDDVEGELLHGNDVDI